MAAENFENAALKGNDLIEGAIHAFYQEQTDHRFMGVCMAVRSRIVQEGHLLFPVDVGENEEGCQTYAFKNLEVDGHLVMVAFTSLEEMQKGPQAGVLSTFIDGVLESLIHMDEISGLMINPWGEFVCLGKEDIAMILMPGSERFI